METLERPGPSPTREVWNRGFPSNSQATSPKALQMRKRGPGRSVLRACFTQRLLFSRFTYKAGKQKENSGKNWVPNSGPANQAQKMEPQLSSVLKGVDIGLGLRPGPVVGAVQALCPSQAALSWAWGGRAALSLCMLNDGWRGWGLSRHRGRVHMLPWWLWSPGRP